MDGTLISVATDLMPYLGVAGGAAASYVAGQGGEAAAEKARALLERIRRGLPTDPDVEDVTRALQAALESGEVTPAMLSEFTLASGTQNRITVHGNQHAAGSIFFGTVNVDGTFNA